MGSSGVILADDTAACSLPQSIVALQWIGDGAPGAVALLPAVRLERAPRWSDVSSGDESPGRLWECDDSDNDLWSDDRRGGDDRRGSDRRDDRRGGDRRDDRWGSDRPR